MSEDLSTAIKILGLLAENPNFLVENKAFAQYAETLRAMGAIDDSGRAKPDVVEAMLEKYRLHKGQQDFFSRTLSKELRKRGCDAT